MKKNYTEILPGDRFGKLTVIKCAGRPKHLVSNINYYLCSCECGNTKEIRRSHLLDGKTISCGCYRQTFNLKSPGEISHNYLYNMCKQGAIYRKLEFVLTKEEHKFISSQDCFYCGKEPRYFNVAVKIDGSSKSYKPLDRDRSAIFANGVDRHDSALGYTFENSKSCCANCNRAKWELTEKEFIEHCRKIVTYQDSLDATNRS